MLTTNANVLAVNGVKILKLQLAKGVRYGCSRLRFVRAP
jgi:hypothetical protein